MMTKAEKKGTDDWIYAKREANAKREDHPPMRPVGPPYLCLVPVDWTDRNIIILCYINLLKPFNINFTHFLNYIA